MFDYEQRPVGTVRIAARNGTVINSGNWVPQHGDRDAQQRQRHSDEKVLAGPPPPPGSGENRPPADYRQPEYQDRPLLTIIPMNMLEKRWASEQTDMVPLIRSDRSICLRSAFPPFDAYTVMPLVTRILFSFHGCSSGFETNCEYELVEA